VCWTTLYWHFHIESVDVGIHKDRRTSASRCCDHRNPSAECHEYLIVASRQEGAGSQRVRTWDQVCGGVSRPVLYGGGHALERPGDRFVKSGWKLPASQPLCSTVKEVTRCPWAGSVLCWQMAGWGGACHFIWCPGCFMTPGSSSWPRAPLTVPRSGGGSHCLHGGVSDDSWAWRRVYRCIS